MSGTGLAQVVLFALAPVITRLFSPHDFGILGSFNAVLAFIAAGVTFQYSEALMLPKKDSDAANVFAVSVIFAIMITLAGIVVVSVFSNKFLSILNATEKPFLLWLLPIGVFLNGMNQSFQAWCIRRKDFVSTSLSQIIRAITGSISQVGLGILRTGATGLIGGVLLGDGLASINLVYRIFRKDASQIQQALSWTKIRLVAKEYRDFPIYSSTQNMLTAFSFGLPIFFLSYFYGLPVAGAYAFGLRVLQAPINLFLTPIRQVLFQKASESYNLSLNVTELFKKATLGLFFFSFTPFAVMFLYIPNIFFWVFGEEWFEAGIYAKWLILWQAFVFCNVPAVLFAKIFRQQRKLFLFDVFLLIIRVSVLSVGGLYLNAINTIILFSISGMLMNLALICWIWLLLKKTRSLKFLGIGTDEMAVRGN